MPEDRNKLALSEELLKGIDNLAAAEEHLTEVAGKTNNEELKKDCRKYVDLHRTIRQNIANGTNDLIFGT